MPMPQRKTFCKVGRRGVVVEKNIRFLASKLIKDGFWDAPTPLLLVVRVVTKEQQRRLKETNTTVINEGKV